MRSSVSGRHYTKLRKDCQTRVNFGRVIQLSAVDQLDPKSMDPRSKETLEEGAPSS